MKETFKICLLFVLVIIVGAYLTNIGVKDYGFWLGLACGFSYLIGKI